MKFFLCFFKNFYSVTIVCIFSPSLHPTPANPTSLPHLNEVFKQTFFSCIQVSSSLLECTFYVLLYSLCIDM